MVQRKINAIMQSDLVRVKPETLLIEAFTILRDNWIRHLPVVNDQDQVVGIISERDFERAKVSGVGPTVESRLRVKFPSSARVADFMTEKLYSVSVHDNLKVSIDVMVENKISSCLVLDGDKLVGIVTSDDLLLLLKRVIDSPNANLRDQLEVMLKTSPLGVFGYVLANSGI